MAETAFPDALPALSRLHWYVLERVLGQGGFGITYLAKDTNLDQRVAIKEYLPVEVATRLPDTTVRARTEELRDRYRWGLERFIQEARTLARFDHPNIVRVLSVFEFNNTAYMVMRFEEGGTLSMMLDRRGTLPEPDLLRLLLPILGGLELVHTAGFIHRDIKPDNILISNDGRPVLLDFGSARQSLGTSNMLTILIAPGYAPFEQYYSDPSSQGPWTDIYGLGATCYRVICGRQPMDAVSRSKGILGSTQEVMMPASVVGAGRYSGRVLAAVDHALAFAEKDRPQTIAEWRHELVDEGAAQPAAPNPPAQTILDQPRSRQPTIVAAAQPSSRERVAQPTSGNPWKWALVAAAVGALAVAVYAGRMWSSDETQNKIAALEKQFRDKEAADAERERKAKEQAEEEARKRKAQDQPRVEENKTQPETPSKAESAPALPKGEAHKGEPPKRPQEPVGKPPVNEKMVRPPSKTPPPSPEASQPPAKEQAASAAPAASLPAVPQVVKPVPPTPAEQLAEAERATKAQRYTDAMAILKPLADAGNAQAQFHLGEAYAEGRGLDRDINAAERWYEKAALQGETGAQIRLGAMFATGTGVPRNNNLAYVWYGTAARLGSNAAKVERDKVAALLQPAEREQADKLIAAKVEGMKKP